MQLNGYKKWADGEPNESAGKCVKFTNKGWRVADCSQGNYYVCQVHACELLLSELGPNNRMLSTDDLEYRPGANDEGHLTRGLWSLQYDTYDDGAASAPCGLRVDVQSGIEVFRRFDTTTTSDVGYGQATRNISEQRESQLSPSISCVCSQLRNRSCRFEPRGLRMAFAAR